MFNTADVTMINKEESDNGRVENSGQRALLQTTIFGDNGLDDRIQVIHSYHLQ